VESNSVSELPYPEPGISEETRKAMYPDNYSDKMGKVFTNMIDEIVRPNHVPSKAPDHSILIDELELLHEAHITVGGQQNRFNASVIRAALNVIRAL
jgi:hypothetical protein